MPNRVHITPIAALVLAGALMAGTIAADEDSPVEWKAVGASDLNVQTGQSPQGQTGPIPSSAGEVCQAAGCTQTAHPQLGNAGLSGTTPSASNANAGLELTRISDFAVRQVNLANPSGLTGGGR